MERPASRASPGAVLNMLMPRMDGLTLAEEIRKQHDAESLPLVLLTSLGGTVNFHRNRCQDGVSLIPRRLAIERGIYRYRVVAPSTVGFRNRYLVRVGS